MNKILITGASGLVGSRFVHLYPDKDRLLTPDMEELNIADPESVKAFQAKYPFDAVVNFAAFTNVNEAEKQRDDRAGSCWQINVEGVHHLAFAAMQAFMIQISTDMVFSGSNSDPGPYDEDHRPEPESRKVNWYGWTKAQGEKAVPESGAVVRINNPVRAHFAEKSDYLRKMLQLADENRLYPLFSDQQVGITDIDEACLGLQKILEERMAGVFHLSSADLGSPYEIGSYFLARVRPKLPPPQATTMPDNIRYPKFGGLQTRDTQKKLEMKFKTWKEVVEDLVKQGVGK